jgi:hypothetical protein
MLRATALWNVYDATGSPATVGLLGLVTFLPAPLLSLGGGVMADRADRKRIVLSAQAVELACALGFAIAAARGALSTTLLFLLYAVNGGAIAFESPARQAVLPSLVAREDLGRAVTVMSTAHALLRVRPGPRWPPPRERRHDLRVRVRGDLARAGLGLRGARHGPRGRPGCGRLLTVELPHGGFPLPSA